MNEFNSVQHEFVHHIPPGEQMENGVAYVSIPFATVVHRCCCGCGNEVVTPLDPSQWQLTFDGRSISLSPSIGNWNFACKSHYWIQRNHVTWACASLQNEPKLPGFSRSKMRPTTGSRIQTRKITPSPADRARSLWGFLGRCLRPR